MSTSSKEMSTSRRSRYLDICPAGFRNICLVRNCNINLGKGLGSQKYYHKNRYEARRASSPSLPVLEWSYTTANSNSNAQKDNQNARSQSLDGFEEIVLDSSNLPNGKLVFDGVRRTKNGKSYSFIISYRLHHGEDED